MIQNTNMYLTFCFCIDVGGYCKVHSNFRDIKMCLAEYSSKPWSLQLKTYSLVNFNIFQTGCSE